jgi:UDP-N-acetylmuramoylalanine--D-glutamate ligase
MMREPAFTFLSKPVRTSLLRKNVLVLGLGDTGLSVARWVERQGGKVRVADTRATPPGKAQFSGELHAGAFQAGLLEGADLVCVSPGLSVTEPLVREAAQRKIPVVGDIELFAWQNTAKVIAVTGTNGKSTVTALAGHLLRAAGVDCEVAGNIGPPVLEALMRRGTAPAAWVLELSSYQLETTWSLAPAAAAMLNLTEDHFDRYASLEEYAAAKARVFIGAGLQVLNRDDPRSAAMSDSRQTQLTFGLDAPPRPEDLGLVGKKLVQGSSDILPIDELAIRGSHNVANALAACALVSIFKLAPQALRAGLKTFAGLPHRLQLVAKRRGVEWYDDSKGTNVGATVAALRGLGRKSVLILGGEGKGQDFSPLREPVREAALHVLLIGRDAPLIEKALSGLPTERCASLEEAVRRASQLPGEAVLLSPACASFDMFRDYRHRGEVFAQAVKRLGP